MFNNSFSIYTVDATTFKEINTGFDEVVSDVAVPVLKEEKYPSVYEALKKLEKEMAELLQSMILKIYYFYILVCWSE